MLFFIKKKYMYFRRVLSQQGGEPDLRRELRKQQSGGDVDLRRQIAAAPCACAASEVQGYENYDVPRNLVQKQVIQFVMIFFTVCASLSL